MNKTETSANCSGGFQCELRAKDRMVTTPEIRTNSAYRENGNERNRPIEALNIYAFSRATRSRTFFFCINGRIRTEWLNDDQAKCDD